MMESTVQTKKTTNKGRIPRDLIYEEMDGQPVYYAGYREVINNDKTLNDIIGSSSLEALIIKELLKYLYVNVNVNETQYEIFANETGLHLSSGNNLASDIAIYKSSDIQTYSVDEHYFKMPPEVVIEVDTKADLTDLKSEQYLRKKTQKLLGFGLKKVIWVLSESQLVILAENNQDWLMRDWHKLFEVLPGHSVNLGEMLKKKGIE